MWTGEYFSAVLLTAEGRVLGAAVAFVGMFLLATGSAAAISPAIPTITEPGFDGELVSPADVHMVAGGFDDPDGDTQGCSDWEIRKPGDSETIWQAPCSVFAVHIHLGDGTFVGSYTGNDTLVPDTDYELRVRFHDSAGEIGPWATRPFRTDPPNPPGTPSENPWIVKQPGYVVQKFASGLQLPVDIAFVPNPGPRASDPLLYVTELHGAIKTVARDGTVSDYASGLLNFSPTGDFPGSGEQGVAGITVDPASGDVFASLVYDDGGSHYGEVLRFHSDDGGQTASGPPTKILDIYPDPTGPSHQISNLTIGPDGKLYVHIGEGLFYASQAENLDSYLGKILRINLNGTVPTDNPFYDEADGIGARDRVVAYGLRNPFGGAWRASNGAHYEVENGPDRNDRLARISLPIPVGGYDFGWNNHASSMLNGALYTWSPTYAPVNITFVQPATFGGSGFPDSQMDHSFVSESGPTYASGPQLRGKRIVEFDPASNGEIGAIPAKPLVEYGGVGYSTVVGLAAGPGGLYFTDLYNDGAGSPDERGANIWRVCFQVCEPLAPQPGSEEPGAAAPRRFTLKAAKQRCRKKFRGKARARCIKRAKAKARAL